MARLFNDRAGSIWAVIGSCLAWIIYLFLIIPTLIVIPISFGSKDEIVFPPPELSLYLYGQFFSDPTWVRATLNSVQVAAASTVIALVVGVPAAYALARSRLPGRPLIEMVVLYPMLVPTIILALGTYLYFGPIGLAGTRTGLIAAHSAYVLPFVFLTIKSGLESLDARVEAAADVMGATRTRILVSIVLPQLVPSLIAGGLFAFLMSFDEVVLAWFLTGVSTTTLPVKMFNSIHWEISPVIAAVATMLTILSLVLTIMTAWITRTRNAN